MHKLPLLRPYGPVPPWRDPRGVFYELADDLLFSISRITNQYAPFHPHDQTYYVPNLKKFREHVKAAKLCAQRVSSPPDFTDDIVCGYAHLSELHGAITTWRNCIETAHEELISACMKNLYKAAPGPEQMREDLTETMNYILSKIAVAKRQGKTITILGI